MARAARVRTTTHEEHSSHGLPSSMLPQRGLAGAARPGALRAPFGAGRDLARSGVGGGAGAPAAGPGSQRPGERGAAATPGSAHGGDLAAAGAGVRALRLVVAPG